MGPHKALEILEQATQNLNGNRKDHLLIIEALKTIGEMISQPKDASPRPQPVVEKVEEKSAH